LSGSVNYPSSTDGFYVDADGMVHDDPATWLYNSDLTWRNYNYDLATWRNYNYDLATWRNYNYDLATWRNYNYDLATWRNYNYDLATWRNYNYDLATRLYNYTSRNYDNYDNYYNCQTYRKML